ADPAPMAALLRAAIWPDGLASAPVGGPNQRGHGGSDARAGAGGTFRSGPGWDQTGQPVAVGNTDSDRDLGFDPARIFGGRQRGPLRREYGGGLYLEPDLYGHFKRLDRGRGGLEQGGSRGGGRDAG